MLLREALLLKRDLPEEGVIAKANDSQFGPYQGLSQLHSLAVQNPLRLQSASVEHCDCAAEKESVHESTRSASGTLRVTHRAPRCHAGRPVLALTQCVGGPSLRHWSVYWSPPLQKNVSPYIHPGLYLFHPLWIDCMEGSQWRSSGGGSDLGRVSLRDGGDGPRYWPLLPPSYPWLGLILQPVLPPGLHQVLHPPTPTPGG